jgi:hypothetical protein
MSRLHTGEANALLGYPADARLLIINADDFGLCHAINAAIVRSLRDGIVCSTTVMAPCPWALHALQALKSNPAIPFGIHLTVICDPVHYRWGPLTCREKVPSLVDETGYFYSFERMPEFLTQVRLGELEAEFRAQIERVLATLSAQQIVFPAANSAEITSLPAADASAMTQYAGQTMTTGDQAHTYAENFIKVHLGIIGQGKTYDYFSGKSIAEATSNPKQSAADEAITLTLFRGDTLRSLLDQAWAFWFVGTIALYAGIGLVVAAVAVFLSLLFEVFVARRSQDVPLRVLAA